MQMLIILNVGHSLLRNLKSGKLGGEVGALSVALRIYLERVRLDCKGVLARQRECAFKVCKNATLSSGKPVETRR